MLFEFQNNPEKSHIDWQFNSSDWNRAPGIIRPQPTVEGRVRLFSESFFLLDELQVLLRGDDPGISNIPIDDYLTELLKLTTDLGQPHLEPQKTITKRKSKDKTASILNDIETSILQLRVAGKSESRRNVINFLYDIKGVSRIKALARSYGIAPSTVSAVLSRYGLSEHENEDTKNLENFIRAKLEEDLNMTTDELKLALAVEKGRNKKLSEEDLGKLWGVGKTSMNSMLHLRIV